jgi:hypothetical protein
MLQHLLQLLQLPINCCCCCASKAAAAAHQMQLLLLCTCRAWNMTHETLLVCPLSVSTSQALLSAHKNKGSTA